MNILVLNWRDPKHPLAGGAEISLLQHSKYWVKKGANVTWISANFDKENKDELRDNIRFIRKGNQATIHFLAFISFLKGDLNKYDLVIDSFHFIPFLTPLYIKKKRVIALINEVAGRLWFANFPFPIAVLGYYLENLFLSLYKKNKFITSSESTKRDLVKNGIPVRNITIIHHGLIVPINMPELMKEKKPTILFINRISNDKGIKDTLLAFELLKRKIDDLNLWIAGKEEKAGSLQRIISEILPNERGVRYFGYVSEKMKFSIMRRSWVLVYPSLKEGWGLTVIEAGSQGTPTVGYQVEGLTDSVIDENTGLLTDLNYKSLAEALERLLTDKKIYKKLSFNAACWARKFNWDKSGESSWQLINEN